MVAEASCLVLSGLVDCADLLEPADNHVTIALTSSNRSLPGQSAADGNRAQGDCNDQGGVRPGDTRQGSIRPLKGMSGMGERTNGSGK